MDVRGILRLLQGACKVRAGYKKAAQYLLGRLDWKGRSVGVAIRGQSGIGLVLRRR